MKGLHVPIELKFDLLKDKIEETPKGFIVDNFPGTQEDLNAFNAYLVNKKLKVDHVFYLNITKEEMLKRMIYRGRRDDDPEIVLKRRENQDKDREAVLRYFRDQGLLREIDGLSSIDEIHRKIISYIND
ncbi:MAG: Adenylate kinase [uncultured bacterium]|nr:MAG: Adenylate kinase [uncultured bacterium]